MLLEQRMALGNSKISGDHLSTHFFDDDFRHPAQFGLGLGRVTQQRLYFGRTEVARIDAHNDISHR